MGDTCRVMSTGLGEFTTVTVAFSPSFSSEGHFQTSGAFQEPPCLPRSTIGLPVFLRSTLCAVTIDGGCDSGKLKWGMGKSNIEDPCDLNSQPNNFWGRMRWIYISVGESFTSIGIVPAADMWTTVATCSADLRLSRGDTVTSVL